MSARALGVAGVVILIIAAVVLTAGNERAAGTNTERTVVVELFTSQGCSSCPPADRALSAIGRDHFDGVVVPLAFHVDYWNSLGWSDPFSSPRWSERQRAYAAALKSQVYTPQVVIDGSTQLVGSYEARVRQEIARRLAEPAAASIAIGAVRMETGRIHVEISASLAAGTKQEGSDVNVVLFENGVRTDIRRGENSGLQVTNDHVVRSMIRAFSLESGKTAARGSVTIPLDPAWRNQSLGIAAFVQNRSTLAIEGAGVRALSGHPL